MDLDLYDEFGNYIGPDLDEEDEDDLYTLPQAQPVGMDVDEPEPTEHTEESSGMALVQVDGKQAPTPLPKFKGKAGAQIRT